MGLLEELAAVGFPVSSVDELRESGMNYRAAVPALLKELGRETDYGDKEWTVRALSVPWAKPTAIEPLLREFRNCPNHPSPRERNTQWAIGNALCILWNDAFFDDYVDISQNLSYGRSRRMVVLGFGKSKLREEATEFLLTLVDDPDVAGHAITALAKLAQPAAREALQQATSDSMAWIRKVAKKGLERLDSQA